EYRADVVVPAELPADSNSFRAQQRRWTKGGVQVARKLLPRLVRSPLPRRVRFEAAMHLSSYAAYPLLVALALLRAPARLLVPAPGPLGLFPWQILAFGAAPLGIFYFAAQRAAAVTGSRRRLAFDSLQAMALGTGLALGNAIAVLEGLFGRGLVF